MDSSKASNGVAEHAWDRYHQLQSHLRECQSPSSVLQLAADTIADCGLFRCVVISLHDADGNLGHIGYTGVPKELIDAARRAPRVQKSVREAVLQDRFLIGASFFVPVEADIDLSGESRHIPSRTMDTEPGGWQSGDELFTPLRRADGDVIGFCSVDEPIDGQRPTGASVVMLETILTATSDRVQILQLESDIQLQRSRLAHLVQSTGDVLYRIDSETRSFSEVSPTIHALIGVSSVELYNLPYLEWLRRFVHPDDRDRVQRGPDDASYLGDDEPDWSVTSEYRVVHQDGTIHWIRDIATAILDDDGRLVGFEGVLQDISSSRRLTQELADTQRDYRLMANNARDLIYAHDEHGQIVYVSPSAKQYLGVSPEECLGTHFSDWLSDSPINEAAFATFQTQINEGEDVEPFLLELRGKDGRVFIMEFNETVVRGEDDRVTGVQGLGRDVTERERAMAEMHDSRKRLDAANTALKSLVNQARRRQDTMVELNKKLEYKNDELESFLHIVAHDLRAPLISLRGLAGLLRRRYAGQLDERGHQITRQMGNESSRLATLIGDVLMYATAGTVANALQAIDVRALVQTIWERLDAMGRTAGSKLTLPADSIVIHVDPVAIERVIENLLINAVMHRASDRSALISLQWNLADDGITIRISDNGIGITPEDHAHIFELFYRGRNVEADGSGMGLAIVSRIVTASQGTITASRNTPVGTTFTLTWPCSR